MINNRTGTVKGFDRQTMADIIRRMPKHAPVKAILFDLGKVLLHFDFAPAFRTLSKRGQASVSDIEAYFVQSGLEVLYDGGKINSRQFYTAVKKGLGLTLSFNEFRSVWNHIFTPIPTMIRLVGKLRARGYRLVLISNTNAMHFAYAKKRFPVFKKFHRLIASYAEGMRKPDERLYRLAAKACRAKPGEILYIDDRADLTEAAAALGFLTFTFKKNPEELLQTMKKMDVL